MNKEYLKAKAKERVAALVEEIDHIAKQAAEQRVQMQGGGKEADDDEYSNALEEAKRSIN
jgi:hypothetical protein